MTRHVTSGGQRPAETEVPSPVATTGNVYRFAQGSCEVIVVSDGHLTLPTSLIAPNVPALERSAALEAAALGPISYEPAANVALIRSDGDLILFDTGGTGFQPDVGRISDSLALAGVDASDITKVVFTHGHPDHIGGTVLSEGSLRFPNAHYYAGTSEWDFWNGDDVWSKLPREQHPFAVGARRTYEAVRDRVTTIRPGDDVHAGIRALATPGHTPGHLSFEVAGGDELIVVGDAVTAPAIFFPHPDWTFGFDFDDEQAVGTRRRLLDRAAHGRTKMLGYHWPFPGLGYAERDGRQYRFIPAADHGGVSAGPSAAVEIAARESGLPRP